MAYDYKLVITDYSPTGTLTAEIATTPSTSGTPQAITYETFADSVLVSVSVAEGGSYFLLLYDDGVPILAANISPGEHQYPLVSLTQQLSTTDGRVELAPAGLDQLSITPSAGQPTTLAELLALIGQMFRGKTKLTKLTSSTGKLEVFADDGTTVLLTQDLDETASSQTKSAGV